MPRRRSQGRPRRAPGVHAVSLGDARARADGRPPARGVHRRRSSGRGLARLEGGRAFVAFGQFQGALALIVRLAWNGSAPALRRGLVTRSRACRSAATAGCRRLIDWVRRDLFKGEDDAAEEVLVNALGGPTRPDAPISSGKAGGTAWIGGRRGRADAAHSQRQGGYPLDAAVQLHSTARSLSASSLDLEDMPARRQRWPASRSCCRKKRKSARPSGCRAAPKDCPIRTSSSSARSANSADHPSAGYAASR